MPEVATTMGTMNFDANHSMALIPLLLNYAFIDGRGEAGPTRTRIVLVVA